MLSKAYRCVYQSGRYFRPEVFLILTDPKGDVGRKKREVAGNCSFGLAGFHISIAARVILVLK